MVEANTWIIDTREDSFIEGGFLQANIPYLREKLDVGDVFCSNIIFEFKKVSDLVSSWKNFHLQKQLLQHEQRSDLSFLIITGSYSDVLNNRYNICTAPQLIGILSSINARFPKVKVIETFQLSKDLGIAENLCAVLLMKNIVEKMTDGKTITLHDTELMSKQISIDDVKLRMIVQIPGIGIKGGTEILKSVSLSDLFNLSVEELGKKIGLKKAEKIKKYIEG